MTNNVFNYYFIITSGLIIKLCLKFYVVNFNILVIFLYYILSVLGKISICNTIFSIITKITIPLVEKH